MRGVLGAASENDLYNQLQTAGMELLDCRRVAQKAGGISFGVKRINVRDLIQFFIHMEQMQSAGVPLLDALSDIRDTTENQALRDIMSEVYRDVSDGASLSESMEKHPKVFKVLYVSLIKAGEDTGDLTFSYRQLVKYLKWVDDMQSKIRKATRYPIIVCVVVLLAVAIMMGLVVPQIVGFIRMLGQELPLATTSLIATSDFFANPLFTLFGIPFYGGLVVILTPFIIFAALKAMKKMSHTLAYKIDLMYLNMPIMGPIIRKITIAQYAQTFASLFAAGIDVVRALKSAKNTVTNV
ncbi:MAG TPA: type II secretion system F family protein, partial [Alphaproteobacteria bacterium]|nr:type II secretion system F family protein [Alphaproteobacteria bacterium]